MSVYTTNYSTATTTDFRSDQNVLLFCLFLVSLVRWFVFPFFLSFFGGGCDQSENLYESRTLLRVTIFVQRVPRHKCSTSLLFSERWNLLKHIINIKFRIASIAVKS